MTSFLRPSRSLPFAAALVLVASGSRATAPAGRYTTVSGGVYDTKTKLTWQQPASSSMYTWGSAGTAGTAQAYCGSVDGGAWRVPTEGELLTLVDFSGTLGDGGVPWIDPGAFPGAVLAPYWSSTLASGSTTSAWYVDFSSGHSYAASTGTPYYVRCVH